MHLKSRWQDPFPCVSIRSEALQGKKKVSKQRLCLVGQCLYQKGWFQWEVSWFVDYHCPSSATVNELVVDCKYTLITHRSWKRNWLQYCMRRTDGEQRYPLPCIFPTSYRGEFSPCDRWFISAKDSFCIWKLAHPIILFNSK